MKIKFRTIKIDHLGYTIKIKDVSNHPKKDYVMYVERDGFSNCTLYTKKNITVKDFTTLSHEVLHILQYIAEARNIDITYESENMGYMMQYILNQILGLEYGD